MEYKWYVVQVLSSQEKKTKKLLEENRDKKGVREYIEEVLLPTENVQEVKRGQQKVVEKRMWPGYLLLNMNLNDDSWQYVIDTPGVIDFLGGAKPTPLTPKELDDIMRDLADKKEKVTHKHKFEVGQRVKITDGVFVNFIGTVIEVYHDKGRLSAMVSIFGRDTRVDDLEFTQVENVNEESDVA